MTSPIYLPAAEPRRAEQKAPCQPCLLMLSQDVSILSFVLPVPEQSTGKLREKREGTGDLQQQQQHVGPSGSALTLLGPRQQHHKKMMCETLPGPSPGRGCSGGARTLPSMARLHKAPRLWQAGSLESRTGSWLQLPSLSTQLGNAAHAVHSTSLYF